VNIAYGLDRGNLRILANGKGGYKLFEQKESRGSGNCGDLQLAEMVFLAGLKMPG
jgi:hypothetical protein